MAGGGSSVGTGCGQRWQWDVVLSFAGAQRGYVEQVAGALKAWGVRCFYDADEQIELWGKYLAEELPAIYGEQAAAVVVFISAEYAARDWTRLERRAALGRAVRERREYVLPARFDDTPLPGLLSDMVTVDLRACTPQQFAEMIADKLGITVPSPPTDEGNPEDFETRTRNYRAAEKAKQRAAAAAAKARREQIRKLLDRARKLAAETTAVPLSGSITGSGPGRTSRLGSSLSDHFGRLPARSLPARLPDDADAAPGVQGCRTPGAAAREHGAAPPDRPDPLRAGRPAVAGSIVAIGSAPPVG